MKRTDPTGGVRRPIPQFNTMMIPNCTGSIQMEVAIGSKIGVAIRMIGAISMIHPKMSRIKSTNSAITIGLLENQMIAFAARSGT